MKLYYPLTIDLYNLWPLPVMTAQQGNAGRGAAVTLVASGQVIQLEGETVTFYVRKPDGTVSFLPATISGTSILCDFTTQMLAVPGVLQVELLLSGGTEEDPESISTPIFQVAVQPSNINGSAIESQNEFTALQTALSQVSGAVSSATGAAEAATAAAGQATEAAGQATTAAGQATTAAGSANDAAEAAGDAATAANQATQEANTAAGSANSAASAANQAAQAAQTAISGLKPVATSGKASDVSIDPISGMTAGDVQTALSQLNSNVKKALIADTITSGTILDAVLAMGDDTHRLFVANPYFPSDQPKNTSGGTPELAIDVIKQRNVGRILVIAYDYSGVTIYTRQIFSGSWNDSVWRSIGLS